MNSQYKVGGTSTAKCPFHEILFLFLKLSSEDQCVILLHNLHLPLRCESTNQTRNTFRFC